jgi:PAS domain-containing protein
MTPQVYTDEHGRILAVSRDGAALLNLSPRWSVGRQLPLFIPCDRPALYRLLDFAARGHVVSVETLFRPRERAARPALLEIRRITDDGVPIELAWYISLGNARD